MDFFWNKTNFVKEQVQVLWDNYNIEHTTTTKKAPGKQKTRRTSEGLQHQNNCNNVITRNNVKKEMERKGNRSRKFKLKYSFIKISSQIKKSEFISFIGLFCSNLFYYSTLKVRRTVVEEASVK
jgi:hypothetical protein